MWFDHLDEHEINALRHTSVYSITNESLMDRFLGVGVRQNRNVNIGFVDWDNVPDWQQMDVLAVRLAFWDAAYALALHDSMTQHFLSAKDHAGSLAQRRIEL